MQAFARAQGTTDASVETSLTAERRARRAALRRPSLRPRGLVGVRGAGYTHDGIWYVKRVTHTIKRGEYKQSFTLTRDGRRVDHAGGDPMSQFFGKYRGKVENNIDPLMLGRIQVSVPAVLGDGDSELGDAVRRRTRAPASGCSLMPPVGANVWVEFEGGDPDYPIWSGCFWGVGEVPAHPAIPQMKVFKTDGITLTLSDLPGAGGFTLEVGPPAVRDAAEDRPQRQRHRDAPTARPASSSRPPACRSTTARWR